MTVSVTHATQGATVVTTKTSAVTIPASTTPLCYTSTRSAAMMALAMGQRPKSPSRANSLANAPSKSSTSSIDCSVIKSATITSATKMPSVAISASIGHTNGVIGPQSGGSGSSGSDNDGFNSSTSSTATALRRFYFKSGRSAKSKPNTSATSAGIPLSAIGSSVTTTLPYHEQQHALGGPSHTSSAATTGAGVPKVVIMGSSTASMPDTTISTSTDSASTLVTSVTHTDTSETCDSLDLGDTSGQSEPLFSSLEEPLLTAIQIDSEHDGTELELTSCSMYSRPDMNLQDSTESQESSLSILVGEPSSTTPLLAAHNRQQQHNHPPTRSTPSAKERLPNTAPAPSSSMSHFTFDPPNSPKSARTSEKAKSHFTFKDTSSTATGSNVPAVNGRQQPKQPTPGQARRNFDKDDRTRRANIMEEQRENSPNSARRGSQLAAGTGYAYDYGYERESGNGNDGIRNKKSRNRDGTTSSSRNRYTSGTTGTANVIKTSPKREARRSCSSVAPSKVNSAPPTMKDINFFGSSATAKTKQLSPSTQHPGASRDQRKYSSSSSSGGSETRDRVRERIKDITMFPFDRETLDYQRIQRECFAVDENSSSSTASSDSDEAEHCSVYERKLSAVHHGTAKTGDIFQQYSLLTQQELHHRASISSSGLPSRKNSKRHPESRRESQQTIVPISDAFYPQARAISSPCETPHSCNTEHSPKSYAEMNKFEDIASKFDQLTPKTAGSNANLTAGSNNNGQTLCSPTGSVRGTTPPPLPDLRVDFFSETGKLQHHHSAHKKSYKKKSPSTKSSSASAPTSALPPPHDNLDDCQRGGSSGAGAINVTPNPLEAAVCTQPRATIVVQQPSLSLDNTVETLLIRNEGDFVSVEQGKDLARKRNSQQLQHPPHHPAGSQQQQQQLKRDENMRQLLDVTNTLTFEELRDFEMRYGSPHHSRSQSVKTPGSRASGRPNQLCLPQQRSRVASMPNTGVEEEYYRLRHFSITGKGVINRGDSLKSRRSRSNNSVASSNSSTEHLTTTQIPAPNSARTSATCSLASSRESSTSNPGNGPYRVLMLGGPAVGKSSLVSQFMTSEYLHAYDTSIDEVDKTVCLKIGNCNISIHIEKPPDDDDSGEKSVSVLLSGEESELIFIDHSYTEMAPDDCLTSYDPHGYCVIYSASDRSSFTVAEHVLQVLWTNQNIAQKAVILVGNKADLARSRSVTTEEGKAMATAYDCKFIETSVGINHNVDELLVGLLSQIRLKLENPEKSRDLFRKRSIRKSKRRACSPLGSACLSGATNPNTPLGPSNNVITDVSTPPSSAHSSPRKYRGSRTSTSLKVKGLLGRVWARDSKSKSCENLHVL